MSRTARVEVSRELAAWMEGGDTTLGGLVDAFRERAFAVVFVMLLGVPALPLPTGGVTHVFEVVALLLALQLMTGRDELWVPKRWRGLRLATTGRFARTLLGGVRRLEHVSRPRLWPLAGRRASNALFGLVVAVLSVAAFVAPPFTGLDTLPALGAVLVSLGVLLADLVRGRARQRRCRRRRHRGGGAVGGAAAIALATPRVSSSSPPAPPPAVHGARGHLAGGAACKIDHLND